MLCKLRHLFESQGLGLFFRRTRLPNADSCACASSNDQFGVRTDGTQDLSPFGQTLVYDHSLREKSSGLGTRQITQRTRETAT